MSNTGLIVPEGLPADILKNLSHEQIAELGYWLFAQLAAQRPHKGGVRCCRQLARRLY